MKKHFLPFLLSFFILISASCSAPADSVQDTVNASVSSYQESSSQSESSSAIPSSGSSQIFSSSISSNISSKASSASAQSNASSNISSVISSKPAGSSSNPTSSSASKPASSAPSSSAESSVPNDAKSILNSMTLEEKICQLFIVKPETLSGGSTVTKSSSKITSFLDKYAVGGVVMFKSNITSPSQITKLTSDLQSASKYPLFISVDEEGGSVARIANNSNFSVTKYESMLSIGNTGDTSKAQSAGKTIGTYLKRYGFNLDFAPVADVFSNPENTVIGKRSFGSDPTLVGNMVSAAIKGFKSSGVISCVKHFPGHGDTSGDSHDGKVSVTKTWDELCDCEIIPFKKAIAQSVDMVMVGHINTPNVTSDGLPASLSREMVTGKLRGELGYSGVIITDALNMSAITKYYSSGTSAVKAIQAGVDILLMPNSFTEAYNSLLNAVKNGTISEDRIDKSVLRILKLKEKYGII